MGTLATLEASVKAKLDTLKGTGKPLAEVFDYHTLDNNGLFPYVTFEAGSLSSEIGDSCNNLRSYTFDIFIYQEFSENTVSRQTAKNIIYNCFDSISDAFDVDWSLGGVANGGVSPTPGEFGQIILDEGKILFAQIRLVCKIDKNISL